MRLRRTSARPARRGPRVRSATRSARQFRTRELVGYRTIGGLADYLATRTGYIVALDPPAPAEAAAITRWPPNPRIFSRDVLPAESVLAAALYPDGQLVIDAPNRLISFRYAPAPEPHANPYAFPLTGEYLRLMP